MLEINTDVRIIVPLLRLFHPFGYRAGKKNSRKLLRLKDKVDGQRQTVLRRLADGKAAYEALSAGQPFPSDRKDADRCLADYMASWASAGERFAP